MGKKHILIISQYFYPETFRINDIATEWVKRGYRVTVLTGIPNYPEGRFYKGYSWFKNNRETWNGIEIIRIPLIPRGNKSLGLIFNYLSFVVSGFFWKCFTRIKSDFVFIFEVSPMTQALPGVWYAKKRKIPCYIYVQDLWPDNVQIAAGINNKKVLDVIGKMVDYIYKHCTNIFVTSQSFAEAVKARGVKKSKVIYWPQYAEDFYQPINKQKAFELSPEIPNDGSFKIIFTGNIGQAQGLEILPKVVKSLKDENIKFIIVGDGRSRDDFKREVEYYGISDKFVMISRQPAEKVPELLSCCDVAFLSFMDNNLFAKTIPAKLQSYMACGMPIVASAVGEAEKIIKEADCGVCSSIGDINGLVENIKYLKNISLKKFKDNSRAYYESHFMKKDLMDYIQKYFM